MTDDPAQLDDQAVDLVQRYHAHGDLAALDAAIVLFDRAVLAAGCGCRELGHRL